MTTASTTVGAAVRPRRPSTLVRAACLTAVAAVLFPRLNAVLYEGQAIWQLDREAAILIPVIVVATLALFAAVGGFARRRDAGNRPATTGLVCGILALVGIVAFFLSAPIVFGGLAVTFGAEGRRRAAARGNERRAVAAIVLGAVGIAAGAGIWLAGI